MNENTDKNLPNQPTMNRRTLVRQGAKAAYMVPAILAAVKATERPAYAQTTGAPPLPILR